MNSNLTMLVSQMPFQTQPSNAMLSMPKPPQAVTAGEFKMTPIPELLKATNSMKLHNFAVIGKNSIDLEITKGMFVLRALSNPLY